MWFDATIEVSTLVGMTMTSVTRVDDEVHFETEGGRRFRLMHQQDCCESVTLEDVAGDLADLVGTPLVMAEEVKSEDVGFTAPEREYPAESETWTFYKFATTKGYVTLRWYGESNGYYSERVDLVEGAA